MLPIGATQEQLEQFRHVMGLDRPVLEQYANFLGRAVTGDFGVSILHHRPAFDVVAERLPATIELAVTALIVGVSLGGALGYLAARTRGSLVEFGAMGIAVLGQATPVFWLGIMLVLFFSVRLGWLPTGGREGVSSLILPGGTLAAFTSASVARLLRSSMIEVQQQDFVRTAWAQSLAGRGGFSRRAPARAAIPWG